MTQIGLKQGPMREAAEAKRSLQLDVQFRRLESNIGELTELITQLAGRLYPVLRSEPPTCGQEDPNLDNMVPLAAHMRELNEALDIQLGRVHSIMERLEI